MLSLLDVNILLALSDPDHVHHPRVTAWWRHNAAAGWASCVITEMGFLRIITQAKYPNPVPLAVAWDLLARQRARSGHQFWASDVSLFDADAVDPARVLGPSQLSDIYLLALAVRHGGRLVTLDRGIARAPVRGLKEEHCVIV